MNLRVFQERNSRSRSPKRYSLNRKIKERKHADSCEFGTQLLAPVSSQTRVTESRGRANEFPGYQVKRNNEVRNTALSSLQDGQGQKQSWSNSTPIQHFTMPARSPGDFSRIANQFENNMRRKVENQRYVQVPYTHYPLNYGPHFGNFQGIQSIQSQNPLQNGVGLQGNPRPFMQSYITPMQPGTAVHFSHQMTTQSNEAYNAFTAYNNPFGMFWRPN